MGNKNKLKEVREKLSKKSFELDKILSNNTQDSPKKIKKVSAKI